MTYGITSTGFAVKDYTAIRSSLQALLRDPDRLGPGLDLSPETPLGQVVDAFSLELAEVWELAQASWAVVDPDQAEGAALDSLTGSLFNFPRLETSPTQATLTITGAPGTVIPAGSQVSQVTTGDVYATTAEVTIGGGGTVSAAAEALEDGPLDAPAGSLTVIETPVSGWTSVTNAADGVPGTLDELDPALRLRFGAGRATGAKGTAAALRAKILADVADLSQVLVRENLTLVTDGLGQPGKSFWVIVDVDDPADLDQRQAIAALILANRPAGIQAYGDTAVTVEDPPIPTTDPVVYLSYADDVLVYVRVLNVELDGDEPEDWEDQVTAAIVALGTGRNMGDDVVYGRVVRAVYGVAGIVGATIYVGTGPSTTGVVNLELDPPEIARFDSGRVEITES